MTSGCKFTISGGGQLTISGGGQLTISGCDQLTISGCDQLAIGGTGVSLSILDGCPVVRPAAVAEFTVWSLPGAVWSLESGAVFSLETVV